ncbi:uncharacterized protein LOC133535109 isoform X2 [Nerophis ophidion]|nr:uncharacterized protein LOC133535109 isoform X2 [Nerophis ophidion]XP_061730601.1 uncharacterized protein LOC133535109 isoform X2 [Nerophis ophidion]
MPRKQRLNFQIINVLFTALVVVPQLYVIARPKSSRYCKQPLVNNMSASIALSLIASGFSVVFTLTETVPQGLWASFQVFGLLSLGHTVCSAILTLTASACAATTPELYHLSLFLSLASILSTGALVVKGVLWLTEGRNKSKESSCHPICSHKYFMWQQRLSGDHRHGGPPLCTSVGDVSALLTCLHSRLSPAIPIMDWTLTLLTRSTRHPLHRSPRSRFPTSTVPSEVCHCVHWVEFFLS